MPTPETQPRHTICARGFSYRLRILSDYNAQHYTPVDRIRVGRQRSAILFIHLGSGYLVYILGLGGGVLTNNLTRRNSTPKSSL
jgi:hypothetical protein